METDDAPHARREEFTFADVVSRVKRGEIRPGEAPAAFEEACWTRAGELRAEAASAATDRAARAAELTDAADRLESEAATWSLVWFLLGDGATTERARAAAERDARDAVAARQAAGGDPASRFGGGAPNPAPLPAPLSARVRMAARDETSDPVTFRLNRVVAWLEGTARAAMRREAESAEFGGAAFDDFAENECAWRETANALDASATTDGRGSALSHALDPDGPTRTNAALHPANADADARLCRAVWRLVRGGMVDAARELCVRAGQPWRAASLGGAAGWGPAPVGAAADAQFAASAAAKVAEAISRRRDSMHASDDDAMDASDADAEISAAMEEAATSAAAEAEDEECAAECEAGGGARRRALWKWACSETARQIAAAPATAASRHEAAVYGAFAGDVRATLSACDDDWESSAWAYFRALLDARVDAAVDGREPGGAGPALVDDDDGDVALGVEKRDRDDDGDAADDHRVDAEIDAEGSALAAAARAAAAPRWPTADAAAATPPTAESILDALRPLAEAERPREARAQRDAQRCLILGRTRELVVECALRWVFPERVDGGGLGADGSGTSATEAKPPPGLLRFAAHLLLFLQALLPDGGGLAPGGSLHFHLNKVLNLFVVHLVASRRYELVPRYARHMRPAALVETYARFFQLLAPASSELKRKCLSDAEEWLGVEGEGGVRAVVSRALDDSREVVDAEGNPTGPAVSRGPAHRERVLEWSVLDRATRPEAAAHACALVRQLALQRTAASTIVGSSSVSDENEEDVGDVATTRSGESRARAILAELLPETLCRDAAEGGRPGAAAELGDWAAYFAATAATSTWRDAARARDAAAEADFESAAHFAAAEAAAEAAREAVRAVVHLAAPRAEDAGFPKTPGRPANGYECGFWLDASALVDDAEMGANDADSPPRPAMRLVAHPSRVVGEDPRDTFARVAASLAAAVDARAAQTGVAMTCHVDIARGVVGDGAKPEAAVGQLLVEIETSPSPPPTSPLAPTTPPATPPQPPVDLETTREALALVAADALKGDLPGLARATLEAQAADGSDPETVRAVCRAVCWPSLLLEGAEAEADLAEGGARIVETVADASRGLHALFSAREMRWLMHLQRQGEINAVAAKRA